MLENEKNGLALPTDSITESAAPSSLPSELPEWKVSGIFASHMVLQREMPITVWGWSAHVGAEVHGSWDGESVDTTVNEKGRFELTFSPRSASLTPSEMTLSSDYGCDVFTDILVGDVWLVGGQSNAEMNLAPCLVDTPEIAADLTPDIPLRLFRQTQVGAASHTQWHSTPSPDIIDPDWTWSLSDEGSARCFSAVGYYVGRMLTEKLGIPVGMVMMCAGGACLRELMPSELALELGYDKGAGVPIAGYYNTLIAPLIGISFKGQIFFQGESESIWEDTAKTYAEDLTAYVADERKRFGIDFPFYNVQLCSYLPEGAELFRYLYHVRSAQHRALSLIPKYYLSVRRDLGSDPDYADWAHSIHKYVLSCRIASQILAVEDGIGSLADANPSLPIEAMSDGQNVRVRFDFVGKGLYTSDGGEVSGFSFGGKDGGLIQAGAEIVSPDTVRVSVPEGADPSRLHFCYANVATLEEANLCGNSQPLPAFTVEVK